MPSTTGDTREESHPSLSAAVIVGLVVSLFGAPLLGRFGVPRWVDASATRSFLANSLVSWLLVGVLLVIVVYWERRRLTSIGLRVPSRREVAVGISAGLGGVVLGLVAIGVAVATFQFEQPETLSAISQLSLPVRVTIVATAVITEEILWRGYPIERLTELTGSLWIGAATSGVVFLAVHYPAWGFVGAIPQVIFTLIIVGVYVRSRNVVACMLTHAVINTLTILVLPAFL
ncbi:MAG: CPBP family intramembrane glutamic endopeptidase, partial [Halobacteriales archaeon]|nr:CPBP family intramembrane glutamic endopeptidase [Halobacteriales archaeon]